MSQTIPINQCQLCTNQTHDCVICITMLEHYQDIDPEIDRICHACAVDLDITMYEP